MHTMHQRNVQKNIGKSGTEWAVNRLFVGHIGKEKSALLFVRERRERPVFKRGNCGRTWGGKWRKRRQSVFLISHKSFNFVEAFCKETEKTLSEHELFVTKSLPGPNFMLANQSHARKIHTFEGKAFCIFLTIKFKHSDWRENTWMGGYMHTCMKHTTLHSMLQCNSNGSGN